MSWRELLIRCRANDRSPVDPTIRRRGHEGRFRVDLTPCPLPQRTAGNGARLPLLRVPAKVSFLN
jgi:hypothetical protein